MSLTGFIFGNVDEEGEVEEGGVLDKVEETLLVVHCWYGPSICPFILF